MANEMQRDSRKCEKLQSWFYECVSLYTPSFRSLPQTPRLRVAARHGTRRRSSPRAGRLVCGVRRQQLRNAQPSPVPRRPASTAQCAGAGDAVE
eukprot:scaffold20588_cov69-Phaeocystis_antarctica.AAC.2